MLSFGKVGGKKDLTKNESKLNDYKIEGTIGEGTYGKVKLATHIQTNEKVAIKFINKNKLAHEGDNGRIQNEIKIMTTLDHPNILRAFEVFEDKDNYYIVMERPS
jgi:serine/threonine protein kinase